jgi:hypothetical protein
VEELERAVTAIVDEDDRCLGIATLIVSGRGVCESRRCIGILKTFNRWRRERGSVARGH